MAKNRIVVTSRWARLGIDLAATTLFFTVAMVLTVALNDWDWRWDQYVRWDQSIAIILASMIFGELVGLRVQVERDKDDHDDTCAE